MPPARVARPAGVWRLLRSFGFAFAGLGAALRSQPNFRIHVLAAVVALGAGLALHLSPVEFALLVVCVMLVLASEAMNTALETLCDLVSPGYHPLVKRAKDTAAAAVLITAIGAVVVAGLLLLPRLPR